jgi:hypothetical protein
MANYYGNLGPKVLLANTSGSVYRTYTLPRPQEMTEFPWEIMQSQEPDINGIMRVGKLEFRFKRSYTWSPTETSGNLVIGYLLSIINWTAGNPDSRIIFYPHSDSSVFFDAIITQGSPGVFSKLNYNAFTITVTSKKPFKNIPDPDKQNKIDAGGVAMLNTAFKDIVY